MEPRTHPNLSPVVVTLPSEAREGGRFFSVSVFRDPLRPLTSLQVSSENAGSFMVVFSEYNPSVRVEPLNLVVVQLAATRWQSGVASTWTGKFCK